MPLYFVRNDITKMRVDAIVNATDPSLQGNGGVDRAIHKAAGPKLLAECRTLDACKPGEARHTKGYRLPCQYVIHTVGPIWRGGGQKEAATLASCYRSSLEEAETLQCQSVAIPLISSGHFGFPRDLALQIAVDTIRNFLSNHDLSVSLVVFDKESFRISAELYKEVTSYIDDHYVASLIGSSPFAIRRRQKENQRGHDDLTVSGFGVNLFPDKEKLSKEISPDLAEALRDISPDMENALQSLLDESFSEMLLRKIDEKGISDTECYKRANVDRKLFSKIRSNKDYRPSKTTVLAFAVALELSLDETKEFLEKAGYALSHSSKGDIIVEFFINQGNYNILEINSTLFAFDQSLLGARSPK